MTPVSNVSDIISHHARRAPAAVAVIEGARSWTYAEFDRAIWRAATWFRAQGIAAGERVGVTLPDSALHLVAGYALARMGAVQVTLPERESAATRQRMAARHGLATTVTAKDLRDSWFEPGGDAGDGRCRAEGGDAPWKVVTTSGTTAAPKSVLQTHRMHIAWREINQAAMPVAAHFRYLSAIPLDFFASFRVCMDVHWGGGAVALDQDIGTVDRFLSAVDRAAANYLYLTPMHLQQLVQHLTEERHRLPGLLRLRTGSMTVPEPLRRAIGARLTPNLAVSYGTNEVGSPIAFAGRETLRARPGSVGYAAPRVELRITDDEGAPLPPGETGHIAARAPGMPSAYEDNAQASQRAFRDGWYYPGDLGQLSADGALYLKGRADDLMNFDGIKIYPAELEDVLLAHPAVAEAAAFPLPSPLHQDIPAAAVVVRSAVGVAQLFQYCRDHLGSRAPRRIVIRPSLPRNAAGKVLKSELAKSAAEEAGQKDG